MTGVDVALQFGDARIGQTQVVTTFKGEYTNTTPTVDAAITRAFMMIGAAPSESAAHAGGEIMYAPSRCAWISSAIPRRRYADFAGAGTEACVMVSAQLDATVWREAEVRIGVMTTNSDPRGRRDHVADGGYRSANTPNTTIRLSSIRGHQRESRHVFCSTLPTLFSRPPRNPLPIRRSTAQKHPFR
jgi:hypothetical protein